MGFILMWLLGTILIATGICISARWLGHEVLIGAYTAALVMAILVAGKLGAIPGFEGFTLSASIFVYSATFIFTDVISEVYGARIARKAVFAGALTYPLLYLTIVMSVEWLPHPFWAENQPAFETTMNIAGRIVIASLAAFVVSQLHDVWAFHFWKKKTKGKYLWIRNNASTIVSQAIDTVVFYMIGFLGVFPIWKLILFTFIVKIVIAFVDTPFVYLIVRFLGRKNEQNKPLTVES